MEVAEADAGVSSGRKSRPGNSVSNLRPATISRLVDLALRPTRGELTSLTDEALKALMTANSVKRGRNDRIPEYVEALVAWLVDHPADHLRLPPGLSRRHPNRTTVPPRSLPQRPHGAKAPSKPFQESLPKRSTPPTTTELETFFTHVAQVLRTAVHVGEDARSNKIRPNDLVAFGQTAEALLSQVQAFFAGLEASKLSPLDAPSSERAPGKSWARVAREFRPGIPDSAGPTSSRRDPSQNTVSKGTAPPLRAREWTMSRCLILEPITNAQRTVKTDSTSFANELQDFIRGHSPCASGRLIELVRRTRQGAYQVQFFPGFFTPAQETLREHDISLDSFGHWRLSRQSSGAPFHDTISVVISRIPLSMSTLDFEEEFAVCNGSRFSGFDSQSLRSALRSTTRLSRRTTDSSGSSSWIPSSSLRCNVDRKLGEALLAHGSLVIGFQLVDVRPYHPPVRFCFHCASEGHLARFCRNPPRCRRCGQGHPLRDCPRRSSSSDARTSVGLDSGTDGLSRDDPSPSSCH